MTAIPTSLPRAADLASDPFPRAAIPLVNRVVLFVVGCLLGSTAVAAPPAEGVRAEAAVAAPSKAAATTSTAKGAGSQPISGPFLGYSPRSARDGVWPLLGVPGASVTGDWLPLGGPFRSLAVSSAKSYALGARESDGVVVLIRLRASGRSLLIARPVPEAPIADRIVLSPRGDAAALYSRGRRSLVLLRGLPDAPRLSAEVSLESLPGLITSIAVSDDGGSALIASAGGDGGGVYSLSPETGPRFLTSVRRATGLSFVPGTRDALVADHDTNQVLRMGDVTGDAAVQVLAGSAQGIAAPVAVEGLADGSVFVANRSTDSVLRIDGATGTVRSFPCGCEVEGLRRLNAPGMFELTSSDHGAIAILRSGRGETEIFFAARAGMVGSAVSGGSAPPRGRGASSPAKLD